MSSSGSVFVESPVPVEVTDRELVCVTTAVSSARKYIKLFGNSNKRAPTDYLNVATEYKCDFWQAVTLSAMGIP